VANAPTTIAPDVIPRGVPAATDVMGQAGAENFPVASRLLPALVRGHLLDIYGFARLADDIGDQADGDRLAMLDWLDAELVRAAEGHAEHPLLVRLTPTIHACQLPLEPFQRLIDANRRDQTVHRYDTFEELLGYCELSANPVGELVLRVLDTATSDRIDLSDRVCTGLQLVEHLQDVGEDASRDRVYLPAEDLVRFECTVDDLLASSASPRLRALVRFQAARIRPYLDAGAPLATSLSGRFRLAVASFAAGGHAALDAIERAEGDVLAIKCRPRLHRVLVRLGETLVQGRRRGVAS
jgi:squalene synthase HpnC